MYLAINYSFAAAELVRAGRIDVDFFKTPDWEWLVQEAIHQKPVAVHFNLEAGNNSLAEVDLEKVDKLVQATGTPYINLHIDAKQDYYPYIEVNTDRSSEVSVVYHAILADVRRAVKYFGAGRIILENSPYQETPGGTLRLCVDPVIISHLINETGCGLLLDISHAVISSRYFGMQPEEYIDRLPLQYVKELHFAGIHHDAATGQLTDHLSILADNWQWLDWVLECIHSRQLNSPWLLAFEYGGVGEIFKWRSNPEVIAEQIPQLRQHMVFFDRQRPSL